MFDEQPCSDRHGAAETAGQPVAWMNPSIVPPMFITHWAKVNHGKVAGAAAYTIPLYAAAALAAPAGESADFDKWQAHPYTKVLRDALAWAAARKTAMRRDIERAPSYEELRELHMEKRL